MSKRWCKSFSINEANEVTIHANDAGDYNEALLLTYSGAQLNELYTRITGKPAPTGNTSNAQKVSRLFTVAVAAATGNDKPSNEQDNSTDAEEASDMSTAKKTAAKKTAATKGAVAVAKAPAKKAAAPKAAKLPKERKRGTHREGSRKGELHAWFTDKSPELDAFVKKAVDKGLKESTARGWYSAFKRKAAK